MGVEPTAACCAALRVPAAVSVADPTSRPSPASIESALGGDGWESNPPRPVAQHFACPPATIESASGGDGWESNPPRPVAQHFACPPATIESASGGDGWESNPPRPVARPAAGFEDRGAHRDPTTPDVSKHTVSLCPSQG